MRRWGLAAAAVGTVALLLGACGSSDHSVAVAPPSSSMSSAAPTSTSTTLPPPVPFGHSVSRPFAGGTLEVTVAPPVQGSDADFVGVDLGASEQGNTPWYVTGTFANVGTAPLVGPDVLSAVTAVNNLGAQADPIVVEGLPACPRNAEAFATLGVGQRATACQVFFLQAGQHIISVSFAGATWES